ncbi:cytochrome b N-terminal domain-containing protein [Streptomyces gramineus]|uniref:cytochrome bc1 complex cytochrome b subunit n=1 Tax=Streptomyces gramineus TaxID=910542 RepID=UPI00398B69A9
MGDDSAPATAGQARTGERFAAWADSRLGSRGVARRLRHAVFPDHWSLMLGLIVLDSFVVLVITGIWLSLWFHPSSQQVIYHGSYAPLRGLPVSEAYASTLRVSFDVRGGLLVRQAHHWAALIFLASLLVHLLRIFFTGAFRRPREIGWVAGFLLFVLGMFAGLTGYDLPGDLLSGTGLQVVNGTILALPVVGTYLSFLLFGGEFPGGDLIARFNTLHTVLLPGAMAALIVLCVVLTIRHRPAQNPGPGRTDTRVTGLPPRVTAAKATAFSFLVVGVIALLAGIAQINPVWHYGPFRPDQVSSGSQPDWYMGVADGLLRVMPGLEVDLWGHTLALDVLLPLLGGVLMFLALGAYPFVEAWVTGDDGERNLLDRPRNRPVRTALGSAWISVYVVALVGAANDVIATHLHLSVNAVTWTVRIGLFAAPVVVFVVAERWALGLQRRDRDEVLHGRETGTVERLPHGEYVEVHQPLDQARLHTLTAHVQYSPLKMPPRPTDSAPKRRVQRLRAALSRALYGPGTQIPKPTRQEYENAGHHRT